MKTTSSWLESIRRVVPLLLAMPLMLLGVSCSQVTGNVRGVPLVDLTPSAAGPGGCSAVTVTRDLEAIPRSSQEIGQVRAEGGVWVSQTELDDLLRDAACRAGASHVLVARDEYGQVGVGSWSEAKLFVSEM